METAQICLAVNDKRLTQADFIEWLCATLWAGPGKGFLLALAACLGVVLALSVLSAFGGPWTILGSAVAGGAVRTGSGAVCRLYAALDGQAALSAASDDDAGRRFQAHGILSAIFGD